MKLLKFIISFFLLIFIVSCEDDFKVLNSRLIGKWQLEGLQIGNTSEWRKVEDSVPQIKEFRSDGKYLFRWGEDILCSGSYVFESDTTVRLTPENFGMYAESIETIYSLTKDTLIISNHGFLLLCSERKEKHFKTD